MKIAVYSCNTGNYRNELKSLNKMKFYDKIDYFLFTNVELDLKSVGKWIIHKIELKESLDFMNKNRHTVKYIKFCIPEILKSYDYIIWYDTKNSVYKNKHRIISPDINKIKDLIKKEKEKDIYLLKHPRRKNPKQELKVTIKLKMEKKEYANLFLQKIKNIEFKNTLPDTKIIIIKVNNDVINIFKKIYEELITNKLCRDQNIIQYVFHNMNYDSNLYYFSSVKNLKESIS